ncbi:hypothetical protein BC939DRAFT_440726 [Gamsiella multidivaricata]|uniref:uncharacterized protein n=1 Tax=Gamsiella multidivaricata TaxID=101098 RepID=UPI00221EE0FE|nr:uncharacterized protein BC939DRAFT_440726 [Gamsiella multidivaricata]KAG0354570.1 hypothetical protein BGZ54_001589 [Gamsiella multidivaricata]KAI7829820.1 hypothetical protein BC939DRAFT_440726 [Gamsiella multidivaricata]
MPRRPFKRLQEEPEDIDTDLVDQIELSEPSSSHQQSNTNHASSHPHSPLSDRAGPPSARPGHESQPRRSMHQVDMDLEWPMIDIPQELRELRDQDDSNARSNSQADAIRSPFKRRLFLLLEDPSSSNAAFALNVWVSFAIVLSAVITTIETIPAFRSTDSAIWFFFETTMVIFFTIEFIARIICHSDSLKQLKKFLLSPLAIIDFLSIIPYYIEFALAQDTTVYFRFTIMRLFRLLRVFRTFKYSSTIIMTIEVMIVAIKRSMDALSALFFFLITGTMLFSTLLYFAERGEWDEARQVFVDANNNPSTFDSIPAAFWFVMVTITTTGYGDMVPTTFIGKLISFPAMMCGILLITLPSIIIGRNFTLVWEAMQRYRRQTAANAREPNVTSSDEPRQSFDSNHSYEDASSRPGYSSLTTSGAVPGQQELLDRLEAMTNVLKRNQHTMDILQKILDSHDLVPKKSPFEETTAL